MGVRDWAGLVRSSKQMTACQLAEEACRFDRDRVYRMS
jgi:hypothetical protein